MVPKKKFIKNAADTTRLGVDKKQNKTKQNLQANKLGKWSFFLCKLEIQIKKQVTPLPLEVSELEVEYTAEASVETVFK